MGMLFVILGICAIPVVIRALQELLHTLLHPRYPVHKRGIILVTGTSTGIGHATAVDLAKTTGLTIFASVRKAEDMESLTSLCLTNIVPIIMDVTSTDSIANAFVTIRKYMEEHSLPFIGLVNNAGLGHGIPTECYPLKEAKHVFEVNFFGLLAVTQVALPLLRESNGRIVMISSFAGTNSFPSGGIYCASKHAVEALSDSLRHELRGKVAISIMEPAYVKSVLMLNAHIFSAQVLKDYGVDIEEMTKAYPKLFNEKRQATRRRIETSKADEPQVVTNAIIHAFTADQPYPRYRVANVGGIPAVSLIWVLWALPDSVKDWIFSF